MSIAAPAKAAVVALAIASAGLPGCGEEQTGDAEPAADAELLTGIPEASGEPSYAISVDVAAARSELGFPDDADAIAGDVTELVVGTPEYRLVAATSTAYGPLREAFTTFTDSPSLDLLDGARVQAVAGNGMTGESAVSIVRTEEAFGEIAGTLEASGYASGEGVYAAEDGGAASAVADAGGGIVVLAGSARAAAEVLERLEAGAEPAKASGLIEEVGGSVRLAASGEALTSGCPDAMAIGGDAANEGGMLALAFDEPTRPDPELFDAESLAPEVVVESPSVEGQLLIGPFVVEEPRDTPLLAARRIFEQGVSISTYEC